MGKGSSRIGLQAWISFQVVEIEYAFQNVFLVVKDLVRPVNLEVDWLNTVDAVVNLAAQQLDLYSNTKLYSIPFKFKEPAVPIMAHSRNFSDISGSYSTANLSIAANPTDKLSAQFSEKCYNLPNISLNEQQSLAKLLSAF